MEYLNKIFKKFLKGDNVKNLNELKDKLSKIYNNKFIKTMDLEELKYFFFLKEVNEKKKNCFFYIIKNLVDNNLKELFFLLKEIKNVNSILYYIHYFIKNINNYKNNKVFYYYLKKFKDEYYDLFRKKIFDIYFVEDLNYLDLFFIFLRIKKGL